MFGSDRKLLPAIPVKSGDYLIETVPLKPIYKNRVGYVHCSYDIVT